MEVLVLKKRVLIFSLTLLMVFLTIGCSDNSKKQSSGDWEYSFVVWNGNIYKITEEYAVKVTEEIGEVTKYLDMEGISTENVSNKYEKGTKYFSIEGVNTNDVIVVEEKDGIYRKAINQGKYGE